jgi:hemerythrin-like domain-containing protein
MEKEKDELEYLIRKTDDVIDAVRNGDNDILEVIYQTIKEDTK